MHEVAVIADFCKERLVQIQCADHANRSEIKDTADSLGQECVVIVSTLLRVDLNGNRFCLSNGIAGMYRIGRASSGAS